MNPIIAELQPIVEAFDLSGRAVAAMPFGSGHINDTFLLTLEHSGPTQRCLLQRINDSVFADVPALMSNIQRVCDHLRQRLIADNARDIDRRVLHLVGARDGRSFVLDDRGRYWRVYRFIARSHSLDTVQSPQQAYTAARAFGEFQRQLVDLPAPSLHQTIPHFHDSPRRYAAFEAALAADSHRRAATAGREIDWAMAHCDLAGALIALHQKSLVPLRITHNDTKISNLLLDDATREAMCVIDLDTVMPGLSLYDFGDLARSSLSLTAEDEPDISKVAVRMPIFDALVRGYIDGAGAFLSPIEIQSLPLAAEVMTYTIGLRFLTDYLRGDVYYKTHRPNHNLDRCRTQIALIDSMIAHRDAMLCSAAAARC